MPSVTTVLNILDKPALLNWKVDKHLEQAFDMYKDDLTDFESWIKSVKYTTREEMDKAPQAGTDIHQVLEDYVFTGNYPEDKTEALIVERIEKSLNERGLEVLSKEKYFLDERYGYAGCADLVCVDKNENLWVIDYKSKQLAEKFKVGKMAFKDHTRQLGAYADALCDSMGYSFYEGANIFVCLEDGEIDFHQHDSSALHDGMCDFEDCLSIYKRNTYEAGK